MTIIWKLRSSAITIIWHPNKVSKDISHSKDRYNPERIKGVFFVFFKSLLKNTRTRTKVDSISTACREIEKGDHSATDTEPRLNEMECLRGWTKALKEKTETTFLSAWCPPDKEMIMETMLKFPRLTYEFLYAESGCMLWDGTVLMATFWTHTTLKAMKSGRGFWYQSWPNSKTCIGAVDSKTCIGAVDFPTWFLPTRKGRSVYYRDTVLWIRFLLFWFSG